MGIFGRIRQGLTRTKEQIVERFDEIVRRADAPERRARTVDVETIEALEEVLISADIGMAATDAHHRRQSQSAAGWRKPARSRQAGDSPRVCRPSDKPVVVSALPRVTLIVGVNGTGKTTTVGKLANLLKNEGRTPLICAADTFRAAAVEQLEIWAMRAGVDMVRAQGRRRSGGGRVRRDLVGQGEGTRSGAR